MFFGAKGLGFFAIPIPAVHYIFCPVKDGTKRCRSHQGYFDKPFSFCNRHLKP
ncbi:hypothetical protein FEDK69T_00020 [Flavobacterium enshiense DK69]|nr:hypothetical protein FEDK69T_00020 [Flavobacterium enshiense DK69]